MVWHPPLRLAALVALSSLVVLACSSPSHAIIKKEDISKVFPWPHDATKVKVQVMPTTAGATIYSGLGTWEEVELGPETTFYVTDDLGKEFAYTPSRSPLRRLAPVQEIKIRWPLKTSTSRDAVSNQGSAAPVVKEPPAAARPASENQNQPPPR